MLFFPGGHCSAACDCGWGIYTASGHGVVSFSRPGYGGTRAGPLSPAEFAPLVREVCAQLDLGDRRCGRRLVRRMQAVQASLDRVFTCRGWYCTAPPRRAAVSRHPRASDRWARGVLSDAAGAGLGPGPPGGPHRLGPARMLARLSKLPIGDWWERLSVADRDEARTCSRPCAPIQDSSTISDRSITDRRRGVTSCRKWGVQTRDGLPPRSRRHLHPRPGPRREHSRCGARRA